MDFSSIETLTRNNFAKWKLDIEFALGIRDLDLARREDEPPKPTEDSSDEQREKYEKWEICNRLSILVMKRFMSDTVPGGIPSCDNAKQFLDSVEQNVRESEKAETGNLMSSLTTMRYDGNGSVREHILKMIGMANKLKYLDIYIPDPFLVHIALNSLPAQFGQLKTAYNAQKQKWELDDLIFICVLEEERIHREKRESVNPVFNRQGNQSLRANKAIKFKCYSAKVKAKGRDVVTGIKTWLNNSIGIDKKEGMKEVIYIYDDDMEV